MSLQGTLRTLGIAEVLEFLSGRSATGRLEITADSGHATYWVSGGEIASVDYSFARESGTDAAEATYYALAEVEGVFHFDEDQRPEDVEGTETVSDVLSRTADTADGWSYVEDVIASPDHWLTRSETLEAAVTVQPEWWTALAEIDAGLSSQMLAQRLDMRALAASTMASEMVRSGLLQVGDPQPGTEALATAADVEPASEATELDIAEAEVHDGAAEVEGMEAEVEELIDAPFLSDDEAPSEASDEVDTVDAPAMESPAPAVEADMAMGDTEAPADSGIHNLFGGGAPSEEPAADPTAEPVPADAPHLSVVEPPESAADLFAEAFPSEPISEPAPMPEVPEIPASEAAPADFGAQSTMVDEPEAATPDAWDDDEDGWATDHSQATVAASVGDAYQEAPAASDVFGAAPATDASMPPVPDADADPAGEAADYGTDDRSSVLKFLRRD